MTAPTPSAPLRPLAPSNPAITGAALSINLSAFQDNYRLLAGKSSKADCAAVIKADGYGIGLEQAAKSLWDAGCRIFFVAVPQEGIRTRAILDEATIYILNGLFDQDCAAIYAEHNLRPVIGSLDELADWQHYCKKQGKALPCALHFDTGMNRLGMGMSEAQKIIQNPDLSDACEIALIMSHLACGDEPTHPLNSQQLDRFRAIRALFPQVPASFANSAGIFLGPDYHFDLLRPGIALYGAQAVGGKPNPMRCVATMKSRILDIRSVSKGHSVSYGAAQVTKRDSLIGILSIGYADGYLRAGGSTDTHTGAHVWLEGHKLPIFGRVTMDLIMVDLTDLPEGLAKRGMWVEMFGANIAIDDVATSAGTIGYELLTSLSKRAMRTYETD